MLKLAVPNISNLVSGLYRRGGIKIRLGYISKDLFCINFVFFIDGGTFIYYG